MVKIKKGSPPSAVVLKVKYKGSTSFEIVKRFRRYDTAWKYVANKLIKIDYKLHISSSMQHLIEGYGNKRIFPFGTNVVSRKGIK